MGFHNQEPNKVLEDGTIVITCVGCGYKFNHTPRDQEFYKEKQYTEPKRCRKCRDKKKAQKDQFAWEDKKHDHQERY